MTLLPAFIMFILTVAAAGLFLIPATYERRSAVLNFYWVGTWLFLALLAAVSGGEQTVMLLGVETSDFAVRLQAAIMVCFPLFIVAAWFRLAGMAMIAGLRRVKI